MSPQLLPPGAVPDDDQLPPGATVDVSHPDPEAVRAFDLNPQGIPLYQFAPDKPPAKELPPPGKYTDPRAKLLGQVGSGISSGLAGLDHIIGNIAGMLDSASYAPTVTGIPRLDVFKGIEDWARDRQRQLQDQATEMSGGEQSLAGKVIRGAASSVTSLPVMAAATALGGPVGGMAAMGAVETADQGAGNMVKGAVEGGLMGKFIHVVGPAGRMIRVPLVMGAEYVKNVAQGVDPETALANAMNMGGLSALGGKGKVPTRELPGYVRESLTPRLPESLQRKSQLNPTAQGAVDYLQEEGVPLTGFQLTGDRYLGAMEGSTAHTPLGAQRAREFHRSSQEAMADLSGELAKKVHPEPVTPYEAGKAASDELGKGIAELHGQETQAYKAAWEHAGDPAYTRRVVVKNEVQPLYDEAGEPTGQKRVPTFKEVNMPVDVRWMKEIAQEELPNYKFLPAAEQSQSAAYSIYKALMKMDDFITARQAEKMLQGFKAEVGYGTDPSLRNESQGAAARVIPRLQKAIDAAVAETGRDAVTGLQEGRRLHAEKMGIAESSKKLRDEPVEAFNQLSRQKDGGVEFLKQVAKNAPGSMPKIGRAYLDKLFEQATKEGGWLRADGIFRQWDSLGDQTKGMLFPNGQARALDRFFLASKITAERINTSGTALMKAAQDAGLNPFKWLQGKFAGDILFSPKGIKFLTGIAQNPPRSSAEMAKLRADAEKAFAKAKGPEEPPEKPPTPPEGTPAPSGGGKPAPAGLGQRIKEGVQEFLGEEEGASPSRRGRPMGLQELMGQPEKVAGGEEAPRTLKLKPSGKGGELLTSDLGQALENSVAGRFKLGKEASPGRRKARGLEAMTSDLRYALAEEAKGRGWYTEDVAEMERLLKEARPEFKDPATMGLFKYLLGITSNGVDPELNFDAALRGWDLYKRDGKFSAYDADRPSEFGNPKGTGLTFRANSYASAMERFTKLVEDKGEAGALEWLQTKHPVSELKEYYKDVPVGSNEPRYGSYIFGEKVGSFGANLNGIHTELTADKWWSRSWNRWMGTLMDTDKEGNVRLNKETGEPLLQDDPRNEGERNLMRETASQVAKDLGLSVSELQAILWYAEQRLYRFYGIDASSVSYADAARKQFGSVRPAENAVDSGAAKSGGPDAQPGKGGLSPEKVPEKLPDSGEGGTGKEVKNPRLPKSDISAEQQSWVDPRGKAHNDFAVHADFAAERSGGWKPGVSQEAWNRKLIDKGWIRVRDNALTVSHDILKKNPPALQRALYEAFRAGKTVALETTLGDNFAYIERNEAGEFLQNPLKFVKGFLRSQGEKYRAGGNSPGSEEVRALGEGGTGKEVTSQPEVGERTAELYKAYRSIVDEADRAWNESPDSGATGLVAPRAGLFSGVSGGSAEGNRRQTAQDRVQEDWNAKYGSRLEEAKQDFLRHANLYKNGEKFKNVAEAYRFMRDRYKRERAKAR